MSESIEKELDEDSTFFEKIEKNSTICSNCYRKVKSFSKPQYHSASDIVEYENHVNHSYFDDREKSGRASVKRSYCECGNVDDAKLRPLDSVQIMIIASRIEEHLQEQDVSFDEKEFYSYIKENKEGSDIHFNEEKYFEEAIKKSE